MKWLDHSFQESTPDENRPIVAMDYCGNFRTVQYETDKFSGSQEEQYKWKYIDGCECCSVFDKGKIIKYAYLDDEE